MTLKPVHYEIVFGSDTYRDLSGILICKGRELLRVERGESDLQLLVSAEVRDKSGMLIAKIHRNAAAYVADSFSAEWADETLRVVNRQSGDIVFESKVLGPSKIEINGDFWVDDVHVRARKEGTQIGTNVLSHCTFSGTGKGVVIA